ncbi:MAG TPA: hypothetical protein VF875_15160, partial [Anaeromyxobacter sp.]
AFAPVYAAMLLAAVLARSAALSAAAGLLVYLAGVAAGSRGFLAELFAEGTSRATFLAVTAALPRLTRLAELAAGVARSEPVRVAVAAPLVIGTLAFALALLAVAVDRFDRKDW